jgi:hypothetical protein
MAERTSTTASESGAADVAQTNLYRTRDEHHRDAR